MICSLPLIGIPAARSLWPGQDQRSVFLTPQELAEWRTIYEHPEDSGRWFINYWWEIEDPPRPDSLWTHDRELKAPEGTDPWLVLSGMSWESLAGGEDADLWSWNGKQAQFVENVGVSTF